MGFRFWKRVRLAPGVTLNLSKGGASIAIGPRGAKVTVGPRGRRITLGIPGTGLFYTVSLPAPSDDNSDRVPQSAPHRPTEQTGPKLSFLQKLFASASTKALIDGCRELAMGNDEKAFERLSEAAESSDAAFLAGFVALNLRRWADAERCLLNAIRDPGGLGLDFEKHDIRLSLSLAITDEVTAHVQPGVRGAMLGLVEAYQQQGKWKEAINCLEKLLLEDPNDLVARLSLSELLLDACPDDKATLERVVKLATGFENDTPVHTALLLYKAKALRLMGLAQAARQVLSAALRRKKGRPVQLLRALRYERALAYEALGERKRARSEFEKIYAEDPNYEDVSYRLEFLKQSLRHPV